MREQALGDVEQLGHPDAAARGHEAHRDQVAFAQALLERVVQLVAGQALLAEVEVVVHHRFVDLDHLVDDLRSEEHTSELQSLMRISYAVFCLKKKKESSFILHASPA